MQPALTLPEIVTHDVAAQCAARLKSEIGSSVGASDGVLVDAGSLVQFDSSVLALLLDCRREALALGRAFAVRGLPERLRQLAGLYGVAELMPPATSSPS
ncbi:MAG: STAS domain-containing protein [Pseudomonadota bacterium]